MIGWCLCFYSYPKEGTTCGLEGYFLFSKKLMKPQNTAIWCFFTMWNNARVFLMSFLYYPGETIHFHQKGVVFRPFLRKNPPKMTIEKRLRFGVNATFVATHWRKLLKRPQGKVEWFLKLGWYFPKDNGVELEPSVFFWARFFGRSFPCLQIFVLLTQVYLTTFVRSVRIHSTNKCR